MKEKSISLAEVARLANVHPSTVSRALNGSPLVKEETRQLIQEIAREHGYIPDAVAKSLSQGKTSTLGIIIPEISNTFYSHIVDAIEQIMVQHGYNLILCGTQFQPEAEMRSIRTMVSKRVDALVMCAASQEAIRFLTPLTANMPVVLCDVLEVPSSFDVVRVDESKGILAAVEHLKKRGHTEIGCIADKMTARRMTLLSESLQQCSLSPSPEFFYQSQELGTQCGYHGMYALAERHTLPPAIFATRDNIAVGAMRAAIELGLDIPGQLAIVGYDDLSISSYLYKKLTTIRQPAGVIGENVAEILLRKLNKKDSSKMVIATTLIPELVVRESS